MSDLPHALARRQREGRVMAGGPRSINLSIDDGQPLHGRVTAEGGTPREFHGWLGLLTVLGALLDHPGGAAEPSSPQTGPRAEQARVLRDE